MNMLSFELRGMAFSASKVCADGFNADITQAFWHCGGSSFSGENEMTYKGGCHCGRIAFEAEGDLGRLMECNCSICSKRGYLHWFVPRDKFRLLTPESDLSAYTFRTGKLKHHYCSNCGCGPFIIGPEM